MKQRKFFSFSWIQSKSAFSFYRDSQIAKNPIIFKILKYLSIYLGERKEYPIGGRRRLPLTIGTSIESDSLPYIYVRGIFILHIAKGRRLQGRRQKVFYCYAVVLAVQSVLSFMATAILYTSAFR